MRSFPRRVVVAISCVMVASLVPVVPAIATAPRNATAERQAPANYVPDELLVRFQIVAPEAERQKVRDRHQLVKVRDLPLPGLELVRLRGKGGPPQRAKAVGREGTVRYAEPNHLWAPDALPDDAQLDQLWGLHNTGQFTGGTIDKDIDAPEAWDVAADTSSIVVGVLDEGVDIEHPDLAANIWTNPGEIAGDGIDNDGNGYVDDVHGWNAIANNGTVFSAADGDDHGTHVAGSIAAVAGNGISVAGVSQAKVMPLKFLGPGGNSTSQAVVAIDYAVKNGVDVINASIGGTGASWTFAESIQRAGDAGVVFVASAGNGGLDQVGDDNDTVAHYPSGYDVDEIISVAASDHTDARGSFSNYGLTSVDLAAPGVNIVSTTPRHAKVVTADHGSGGYTALHTTHLGHLYSADRTPLMRAALTGSGIATTDAILLVNDSGTTDPGYSFRIADAGYATPTVTTTSGCGPGPDAAALAPYPAIVWFTGTSTCTIHSTDQASLTTYVNNGGKVLLFGTEISTELVGTTFLTDVLRAARATEAGGRNVIEGISGTPYAGLSFEITAHSADGLTALAGGTMALESRGDSYNGTSMAAPHVAGAAAHLKAKFPRMRATDIKARLMATGDLVSWSTTTTASSRRLNLANALATAVISGTVTNASAQGLAGICVTASSLSGSYLQPTTTDGAGAYALTLPSGDYKLQYRPCAPAVASYAAEWHSDQPDFRTSTTVTAAAGAVVDVDAVLAAGQPMSGTVTAQSGGATLAGICVAAFTPVGTVIGQATTAADGSWSIPGFADGSYQVRFRDCTRTGAAQYATEWFDGAAVDSAKTLVSVSGSPKTGVDATMVVGGQITGYTLATYQGTDYWWPDICVAAYTPTGAFLSRARSSEASSGTYTLSGLGTGAFKLLVTDCGGRGWAGEWYDDQASLATANEVNVVAGSTTVVDVKLTTS